MIKVLIIADGPNWCFARRASALQRYAPDDFEISILNYSTVGIMSIPYPRYDLVFLIAPSKVKSMRETFHRLGYNIPIVASYNSGPGRKGYHLDEALVSADWVVVNNYTAWAQGTMGIRKYNACNISNGVDLTTFRCDNPIEQREPRVLWAASRSKAEDPADVKGYQRILKQLAMILPSKGFVADFRVVDGSDVMDDENMNIYWQSGGVMVCASSSEGTPNIALEAAACGCVVVTTPVGNMTELIQNNSNGVLVDQRHTIAFYEAVQYAWKNRAQLVPNMQRSIQEWDWSVRAKWFYSLFRRIAQDGVESLKPFTYLDKAPEEI